MELRQIEKDVLPEDHFQYSYHRVSAYDPNMCSTARFSPPYSSDHHEIPETGYENIILVPCADNSNNIQNINPNSTITGSTEHHTYTVPPANRQYTNVFDESRVHHHLPQCSTETVYTSLEPRQPINTSQETYVNEISPNIETTTTQIIVHRSPNGHIYQNYYVNDDVNEPAMVELVPIENAVNVYQQQYNTKQVENLSPVEYNYHPKLTNNGELIEHLSETSFVHLEPSMINDQGQESFLTEPYSIQTHNTDINLHEKDPQRILLESTMSPLLAAVNDITQRDAELQSYLNQTLEKENHLELFQNNPIGSTKSNGNTSEHKIYEGERNNFADINYIKSSDKKELRTLRNKNKDLDTEEGCLMVVDKPVESRARASLPTNYLYFGNSTDNSNDPSVFAKKEIPLRTKFGPFEGELRISTENTSDLLRIQTPKTFPLLFVDETNILEVTDENTSNWMRFVRMANNFSEQNLLIFEESGKLYFKSCQVIYPKQELMVGYSKEYAQHYELKEVIPTERESQKIYEKENPYPCYECDERFSTSVDLQNHLSVHDGDEELATWNIKHPKINKKKRKPPRHLFDMRKNSSRCVYCHKVFMTNISLKKHMATHFANGRKSMQKNVDNSNRFVRCNICYKKFGNEEKLKTHRLVHIKNEVKPYQCPQCHQCCSTPAALAAHVKSHTTRHFSCVYCPETFKQVLDFKSHVSQHSVNGSYPCHLCKKKYREYYLVRKHIKIFHPAVKFSCNECGRQFLNMNFLRRHKVSHSEKRDFLCSQCGKQFKRKDKLREHILRIHSENRKQKAKKKEAPPKVIIDDGSQYLELSPRKSKELKSKSNTTDDYQRFIYKCNDCMLGFKRRGMLVNHMAKRHPEVGIDTIPELNLPILKQQSLFFCQYCSKVYKSNAKRKAHILKNHPGQDLPPSARVTTEPSQIHARTIGSFETEPQRCQWCYKQYASRNRLLLHHRKEHPNMEINPTPKQQFHAEEPMDIYRPPCSPENKLLKLSSAALELSSIEDRKFFDFLNEKSQSSLQERNLSLDDNGNGFSKVDVNFKVVESEFGETSSNGELPRLPQLFEESIACI